MTDIVAKTLRSFEETFGSMPTAAAAAPGRVEILGNHTDYNGGLVMSAAIDQTVVIAGSRRTDTQVSLYAADLDESFVAIGRPVTRDRHNQWPGYILGVVDRLTDAGIAIGGFQAAIASNVPIGAGLSSSAALEVSTAWLLKELYPYHLDKMSIARLCQAAENKFVGVNCGLLDQFSSTFGKRNHLLYLDCATLEHDAAPLARSDVKLVICDSMVKHSLTSGHYNERRDECRAAAAYFGKQVLRDVSREDFEREKRNLPDEPRKRAEHIFNENQRVLDGRDAARAGDLVKLGRLMTASHESSRDLFENSTPALDFLVATAIKLPGCYGSRLTGGGWGGATVSLVDEAAVDLFRTQLAEAYRGYSGKTPEPFVCGIGDGARIVPLS